MYKSFLATIQVKKKRTVKEIKMICNHLRMLFFANIYIAIVTAGKDGKDGTKGEKGAPGEPGSLGPRGLE